MLSRFKELYRPNTNLAIDEGTLLWRGRLSFRVFNPQKPVRYGIRSYIMSDSETGFCLDIIPYCGESAALVDTVVKLLGEYAGKGHHLYMDNFYNSVKLCYKMLELKTHVCGTLRRNRGEPEPIRLATPAILASAEGK